jgi:hypothetical protein
LTGCETRPSWRFSREIQDTQAGKQKSAKTDALLQKSFEGNGGSDKD